MEECKVGFPGRGWAPDYPPPPSFLPPSTPVPPILPSPTPQSRSLLCLNCMEMLHSRRRFPSIKQEEPIKKDNLFLFLEFVRFTF